MMCYYKDQEKKETNVNIEKKIITYLRIKKMKPI